MDIIEFLHARLDEAAWREQAEVLRQMIPVSLEGAEQHDSEFGCCHSAEQIGAGECKYHRPEDQRGLLLLASLYAEHPDFQPTWKLSSTV